ncbi:MAG TPA: hypothetical protein VHY84_02675 [Bryobacteraceae bacterium]|jgi:hypothetical protein|nr:hypothetical protein [Bryobacteraceae bacterium]
MTLKAFIVLSLLAVIAMAAGPPKTVIGVITDSMCATGDHSQMKMGPTDGECTKACVDVHGALYVLYNGKDAYTLSDQKTPEQFAGKKVKVTGTVDATKKSIQVTSITAAK